MSVNKELKFSFALDSESFQKVKVALESLTTQAQKLANAMNAAGGMGSRGGGSILSGGTVSGGGGFAAASSGATQSIKPGNNAMVQSIAMTAEAFKKLGSISSGALKAMENDIKRSFDAQMTAASKATAQLETLGKMYESLEDKGSESAQAMVSSIKKQTDALMDAEKQAKQYQKALGGGGPGGTTPGPSGGGGGGGFGGFGGLGSGLMRTLGVAGLAVGVGQFARQGFGLGTALSWQGNQVDQMSRRGAVVNPMVQGIEGGDTSTAMTINYLSKMDSDLRRSVLSKFGGAGRGLMNAIEGVTAIPGQAAGGGAIGSGLTGEALNTKQLEQFSGVLQQVQQTPEYHQTVGRMQRYVSGTQGQRGALAPMIGAGFYRGPTGAMKDTFTPFMTGAMNAGLYGEELAGGIVQGRQLAGSRFGSRYGGMIASANLGGYAGVDQVLAAGARRGGMGAAFGAFGMGADKTAAIGLAQGVLGSGFDPTGTVTGTGLMQAMQGGFGRGAVMGGFTGGAGDFNLAQRALGGIQAGGAVSQGFDPYSKAMNTMSAIRAMPGGSVYAQNALAKMDFKELMEVGGGGKTLTSEAYGITQAGAKEQLNQQSRSVFSRFKDQGKSDNLSVAMREMRSLGMTSAEYAEHLKSTKDPKAAQKLRAMGVFFGEVTGKGAEAGVGYMALQSGFSNLGKGLAGGKTPGGGRDTVTREQMALEAKEMQKSSEQLKDKFGLLSQTLGNASEMGSLIGSMGQFGSAVDLATIKLLKMSGMGDEQIKEFMGGEKVVSGPKNTPTNVSGDFGSSLSKG